MIHKEYKVSWVAHNGIRKHVTFHTLSDARTFLNEAILDFGYDDARLTRVRSSFNEMEIQFLRDWR